jgi:hypothetical protein
MKYLVSALILLGLIYPAQARQRVQAAHPDCNVLWPCEGVTTSARGERVVKAMHGFGVAQKVYRHEAKADYRHIVREKKRPVVGTTIEVHGNGVVRSVSGAVAHVAAHATGAFQCLVTALDNAGYPIRFMGGWRARGSVRGSLHPHGLALDVNQVSRNVTMPRMPSNEIVLANSCGLVSGAQWANGDSGHFQLGGWAGNRNKHYARRHWRHRYASAP